MQASHTALDLPASGLAQLIYVSRSTIPTADFNEAVRQILIRSISNNRLVDLTGQLITRPGFFMQLLEGPAGRVAETYARVAADPRHADLRVVASGPAERRLFRDWSMSDRRLDDSAPPFISLDEAGARALFVAPGVG